MKTVNQIKTVHDGHVPLENGEVLDRLVHVHYTHRIVNGVCVYCFHATPARETVDTAFTRNAGFLYLLHFLPRWKVAQIPDDSAI